MEVIFSVIVTNLVISSFQNDFPLFIRSPSLFHKLPLYYPLTNVCDSVNMCWLYRPINPTEYVMLWHYFNVWPPIQIQGPLSYKVTV